MEASRLGQGLRSAAVFILLVVLGDSAMTSVRGPDARKATFEFATVLDRPRRTRPAAFHGFRSTC